jgi:hypothetical protein
MVVKMTNAMSMTELVRTCFMAAPPDVSYHQMTGSMNDGEAGPHMRAC